MFNPQDSQDVMFIQILDSVKNGNYSNAEELSNILGDYTNKTMIYSQISRKIMISIVNGINTNKQILSFCSQMYNDGYQNLSVFLYSMSAFDYYVDGFTWEFLEHYITNEWSYKEDYSVDFVRPVHYNHFKFVQFEDRSIDNIDFIILNINNSQSSEINKNIHKIIGLVSNEQFLNILTMFSKFIGFNLRNCEPEFIIELAKLDDDILINNIIYDIVNNNVEHDEILGTENMGSREVGYEYFLYSIPLALKKLYTESNKNTSMTNHIDSLIERILLISIKIFDDYNLLNRFWYNITFIHDKTSVIINEIDRLSNHSHNSHHSHNNSLSHNSHHSHNNSLSHNSHHSQQLDDDMSVEYEDVDEDITIDKFHDNEIVMEYE